MADLILSSRAPAALSMSLSDSIRGIGPKLVSRISAKRRQFVCVANCYV
jgi:hypothetical protein